MNLNKKRDLETFYKYCKNEIKFGWMDQNGGRHTGINDGKTYSLQSPEELMTSKLGICFRALANEGRLPFFVSAKRVN